MGWKGGGRLDGGPPRRQYLTQVQHMPETCPNHNRNLPQHFQSIAKACPKHDRIIAITPAKLRHVITPNIATTSAKQCYEVAAMLLYCQSSSNTSPNRRHNLNTSPHHTNQSRQGHRNFATSSAKHRYRITKALRQHH